MANLLIVRDEDAARLADYLGVDRTLMRVLTVLATVLGFGSVIIAYLVAWVIVPKDVDVYPPQTASVWTG